MCIHVELLDLMALQIAMICNNLTQILLQVSYKKEFWKINISSVV